MPTLYTRTFSLKDTLTDDEVIAFWTFAQDELAPAVRKVPGVRAVTFYSGAGALRADLSAVIEMDDAGAYERLLVDPTVRRLLGRTYGSWDLRTAGQTFRREVTAELVNALSSRG